MKATPMGVTQVRGGSMAGYTLTARSKQGYDDTVARVRELLGG